MNPDSEPEASQPTEELSPVIRAEPQASRSSLWVPVIVLAVTFLAGFAPMWLKTIRLNAQLSRAEIALRQESLQLALATAALDARRGDYEPARQRTAAFFNQLVSELDRITGSALPASARAELEPLLAQRDDLITLLARGDPAAAERLANAHMGLRKLLGK